MMRQPGEPGFALWEDYVNDPPRARLELRVDNAPLAWYPLAMTDEALRHVDVMINHPQSRAVVQLSRIEPGVPDTVLLSTRRGIGPR